MSSAIAIAQPDDEPRLTVDAQRRLDASGNAEPKRKLGVVLRPADPARYRRARVMAVPESASRRSNPCRHSARGRSAARAPAQSGTAVDAKWVLRTIQGMDIPETLQAPKFGTAGGTPMPASKDIGWAVVLAPHPNLQLVHSYLRPARVNGAEKSPVPDGQFEANPLVFVPELAANVSERLSVGANASALYLQVLTLPEPTIKNCSRRTGWSPADDKRAASELLAAEHVVTGTRPRAGRTIFLPGPWVQARAPNLPIEQWKLALYDGGTGLAGRYLPTRPVHELFAEAWQRILDRDRP